MATFCPYCDEEIEAAIHNDWVGDYYTFNDDFECPMCGENLEIEVEQEPVFYAHKVTPKQAQHDIAQPEIVDPGSNGGADNLLEGEK